MTKLVLVHLSDFHLKNKSDISEDSTLRFLLRDLQDVLKPFNEDKASNKIFVCISGDLTYQGLPEEFDLVSDFINDIKNDLKPEKVILAPGNHDLNRPDSRKVVYNARYMKALILAEKDSVKDAEDLFSSNSGKMTTSAGMKEYYKFLKKKNISQPYNKKYLYSAISEEVERFKVNFISLNSAFLYSPEGPYYGYIGASQLNNAIAETIKDVKKGFKTLNIAIFHHPFEAIVEPDAISTEDSIKMDYNVVLTGHTHNMRVRSDLTTQYQKAVTGYHYRTVPTILSSARCVIDEHEGFKPIPGYSILFIELHKDYVSSIEIIQRKCVTNHWSPVEGIDNPMQVFSQPGIMTKILKKDDDMYEAGATITNTRAHSHLIIYQRTPSLILGEKPYKENDSFKKNPSEKAFVQALDDKIDDCVNDRSMFITYLFSLDKTKKVLTDNGFLKSIACRNIIKYKGKQSASQQRFVVEPITAKTAGPFIFADDGLIIYLGEKDGEILVLNSDSFPKSESIFDDLTRDLTGNKTVAQDLMKKLSLDCSEEGEKLNNE